MAVTGPAPGLPAPPARRSMWKFQVPAPSMAWTTVQMPAVDRATIRHFDLQNGTGFMWVEVDVHAPYVGRRFRTIGTGWEVPDGATYVGTVLDGPLVWHLFEDAS